MEWRINADEAWGQALEILKLQMTRATFDTWLRNTWVAGVEGDTWTIGVYHAYALDWLENRLNTVVMRSLSRIVGRPVVVRYVVGQPAIEGDRLVLKEEQESSTVDENEPLLEAVREERVTVTEAGALQWTDFYIKLKVAFRKRALGKFKGAQLSVFLCLALHVDRDGVAKPGGIEAIMHETKYSRGAVCSALEVLDRAGVIRKRPTHHGPDEYLVLGYAWFGQSPAPSLWEETATLRSPQGSKSKK